MRRFLRSTEGKRKRDKPAFFSLFVPFDGECGIRTHVPKKDNRISSAARYDHFDNSPYIVVLRTRRIIKRRTITPVLCLSPVSSV